MITRDDLPNPQPAKPTGSGEGGTPEPVPEPIVIPPEIVTYSEPDIKPTFNIGIDIEIKTGRE